MIESIINAIMGGALIGIAASFLLLSKGRIAGISGVLGSILQSWDKNSSWRLSFLLGLFAGGVLLVLFSPQMIVEPQERSLLLVAVAGALVGYGTRLGNGCTSGHGVCGLSRFSARSLVATMTFMATGFATATLIGVLA